MRDRDMGLRIAGVLTSHASFFAGFALIYWWLSSQGIPEFERIFWGGVAFFGGFCFAGFFMMKRFRLAKKELLERIEALEAGK
jgi:uncharacterized BrkB/YihY/UPF0761 family membrane protein